MLNNEFKTESPDLGVAEKSVSEDSNKKQATLFETIHANPLAYYVYALVMTGAVRTVEEIHRHFSPEAKVSPFIDRVLNDLFDQGEFDLDGDKIILTKSGSVFNYHPKDKMTLFPNVFSKGVTRVLRDANLNASGFKKECMDLFFFPDVPEVKARLAALNEQNRKELSELAKYKTPNRAHSIRIVGYVNFVPLAEDFSS